MVIDRQTKRVTYLPGYYYLAHFSKFVRPGAQRVAIDGRAGSVRALAFAGAGGGYTVQLLNSGADAAAVQLEWNGRIVRVALPAMSIATCVWR